MKLKLQHIATCKERVNLDLSKPVSFSTYNGSSSIFNQSNVFLIQHMTVLEYKDNILIFLIKLKFRKNSLQTNVFDFDKPETIF